MIKYEKLIFVCTGNTCRGPMAETIYKGLASDSEMEIFSKGLVVLFPEPANPKAVAVLNSHNLELTDHMSTQLAKEDIDDNTLILTMTEGQKKKVSENYGEVINLYTIKEFVGENGDVTDPYGKDLIDYEDCFVELNRLVKKIVYRLIKEI